MVKSAFEAGVDMAADLINQSLVGVIPAEGEKDTIVTAITEKEMLCREDTTGSS